MSSNRNQTSHRSITVTTLFRIAAAHAGGYHDNPSRETALAELAATSTDPDMLAEAAATHAVSDNWYAITAVDLLIEAGADRALIDQHMEQAWDNRYDQGHHDQQRAG